MSNKTKLVLVGNGPVGHKFLQTLVENNQSAQFDITVFGEESRPAYDRVQLTKWFETRTAEPLSLVTDGFYGDNSIVHYINTEVTTINRDQQTVVTAADNNANLRFFCRRRNRLNIVDGTVDKAIVSIVSRYRRDKRKRAGS